MTSDPTRLRALRERVAGFTGEAMIDRDLLLSILDAAVRVTAERDALRVEVARLQGLVDARRTTEEIIAEKARRTADDLRAVLETRSAELTLAHELLTAERQRAEAAEARAVRAVAAEREACAGIADGIAEGADNALVDAVIPTGVAYLKGRRRGSELCAEAIRARGEGGQR